MVESVKHHHKHIQIQVGCYCFSSCGTLFFPLLSPSGSVSQAATRQKNQTSFRPFGKNIYANVNVGNLPLGEIFQNKKSQTITNPGSPWPPFFIIRLACEPKLLKKYCLIIIQKEVYHLYNGGNDLQGQIVLLWLRVCRSPWVTSWWPFEFRPPFSLLGRVKFLNARKKPSLSK